jgi:hypothetical protein
MTWKQIAYLGYYEDYEGFKTDLQNLKEKNATHVYFEFLQMDYVAATETTDYYYIINFYDTVQEWSLLTDGEKQEIYDMLNDEVKLGYSFGGAGSFSNDNLYATIGSNYRRYESDNIEPLTDVNLSDDLIKICQDFSIYYIDLDIEYINICTYGDDIYNTILNFIGNVSAKLYNSGLIVSHAPQTPYFNNESYGFIYNAIDFYYGYSIDFYNVQYYNVSDNDYITYTTLFYEDPDQYGSILELINSKSTIEDKYPDKYSLEDFSIPIEKIVLGKCIYGEGNPTNYIALYSTDNNVDDPSMTYFLNITYDYIKPSGGNPPDYPESIEPDKKMQLNTWILEAGIMVWLYLQKNLDINDSDEQILNYFSNNSGGTCFLLGTNILCYQNNIEMEISIELLQNGDYVKTHKGEYKKIVFIGYNFYKNNLKNNIKVIKQNKISNDIPNKDLYLTSGHSLLFKDLKYVNVFYDKHYYPENEKIDDYYKIMTSQCFLCDDYDKNKKIEFYFHIVLENENLDGQYGIYANGVLCESMSYNHIPKSGLKKYEN